MYVPPIAPACAPSMISARPSTPERGRPAAIDFATVIRSGSTPEVLHREHAPGPAEAGLDLVGDEDDPVTVADRAQPLHVRARRGDEPSLAQLRLDDDRRHVLRRDVRLEEPLEPGERLGGVRSAVLVGYGAR
jgi:hypothetical protein